VSVSVPTWWIHGIRDQGLHVEVHKEPYDPVENHNQERRRLSAAEALKAPEEAVHVQEWLEAPVAEDEALSDSVTDTQEEEPAADSDTREAATADEPLAAPEASKDSDQDAGVASGGEPLSLAELEALKKRVEELTTKSDAHALIAEFGITFDPVPGTLRGLKEAMLKMIAEED
jgi:hypothetical protein